MTGRLRHGGSAKWNAPRVTENPGFDETAATAKWLELAPLLDRMMQRVGTDGEFGLAPGSSLAGDDQASAPYQLSHAVRACLMAATDHLHAAKVVVVDQGTVHVAAPSSLARGALETLSAAYWMLHPVSRDERVTRALRWQAQNMRDADKAVRARNLAGHLSLDDKLASLDEVAAKRALDRKAIRTGYNSSEAVKYADVNEQDLPLHVLLPWQICSGFAHGRPWAYLGVSIREETKTSESDVLGVRLTSSRARALYPNLAAVQLLERLLRLYARRAGTPLT